MIVINKSDTVSRLIVTVTEINPVTTGSTLHLFNAFTNVSTAFDLPVDTSPYPERYNLFTASTVTFSGLSTGTYNYQIKDSLSGVTETGLMKVVDDVLTPAEQVASDYVFISSSPADDDFIVYKK